VSLTQRLQQLRIEVAPATAALHLAAVAAELREPVVSPVAFPRRRRVVAAVAVALLLVPAAAVAAEDSVPGESLYPVKRTVEWVRSLVDDDIGAIHRLEELEILIDRRAPVEMLRQRLAIAESVVGSGDRSLRDRLDEARRSIGGDPLRPPVVDDDHGDDVPESDLVPPATGQRRSGDEGLNEATTTTAAPTPEATTTTVAPDVAPSGTDSTRPADRDGDG
jgi:hypothetical protein